MLATYPVILAGQDVIQPLIEVPVWGEADVIKHRPAAQHSRHGLRSKQHSYVIDFFFKARKELFADLLFPPPAELLHTVQRDDCSQGLLKVPCCAKKPQKTINNGMSPQPINDLTRRREGHSCLIYLFW